MAYRADIEIGVKGIQQLQNVTKRIEILSTGIDAVNKRLAGAVQSLSAYDANLAKASATLQKVNAGTIAERDAIRQYVQALGQANAARDRQNRLIQEQIALQRKAVATSDAGFGVQGPRQASAATARSRGPRRFSNVVLGAGFPLLFGGGPGAVLGGAAGGLVGGPGAFAAQIGLSAVGQQLDLLVAATAKASTAFTSTSAAFVMMEEKALFSNEATRELAIQLEEQGKVSELSTLLTKELTDTLGNEGVKAMQDLGQTTDKTTKLWNQLTLQLQALIAGPLNGFLTWINTALSSISTSLRFNALQRELGDNAEFRAEVQRRRAARGRGARLGSLSAADQAELLKQFGGLIAPKTQIPVTAEDLRTITASRGAKGPKPPADQSAQLAADLKAMQLMSITQDGIRDALFEGNRQLAIRLEYDQKVYDINRDTEKALLRANYESEKTIIRAQEIVRLKDAELEKADKLRELERDITEEYYSRARLNTRNLTQRAGAGAFDINLDLDPNNQITQKYDRMKKGLEELSNPINVAEQGAVGIGNAFNTAFQEIITGAQSTQQALSNFFKGVGNAFINMATEIISQMIVMYAFKQLTGLFGASGGSLFSGAGPVSGASIFGAGQAAFNPTAFAPGVAFSAGGFVTGPTRALIGEGGEPEYVIPASKMGSAMARYASGMRGGGVINGAVSDNRAFLDSLTTGIGAAVDSASDDPATATAATRASIRESERFQENRMQIMSQQTALERRYERERIEQMASTPGNLNIRYESQVINNVEYVTREQAERMAAQSALRGRELAIGSLQNSVKTRKRVGIA